MEQFLFYYHAMMDAISPFWAEMVGAFLFAIMVNLFRVEGTQKDAFSLISMGFYVIILRDFFYAVLNVSKSINHENLISMTTTDVITVCLTSIATAFFVDSAAFLTAKYW